MTKPILTKTFLATLIAVLGLWLAFLFLPTVTQEGGVIFYLKPGMSKQAVAEELNEQGIITHPLLFAAFLYPQHSSNLKTAEYLFPKGSSPFSIWRQMTTGTGLYYRAFTIVPGWTFAQLKQTLLQTDTLRHNIKGLNDQQIMAYLTHDAVAPEGEFLPETYYYTRGVQDLVILKRAFDLMQKSLASAWETRDHSLPYKDAYQALTAASLIEKEAYLSSEQPIIAGVLVNRLNKHMLLQFDPTVIYGMGDKYAGKIHKQDLREDTAFNTYVHFGLPPTPIAMPSMEAINAALHPQVNEYLYFVAVGDGSHQFSKNLKDHNAAVAAAIKRKTAYIDNYVKQHYLTNPLIGIA